MDVKNWIEWRNFGIWQAENVQEVVSKGLEFQSNTSFPLGEIKADFTINYTFNPVEPVATIDKNGLLHRQMNYVPKHMGNVSFGLHYKEWRIFTDGQYAGKRFTDDFGHELPAHFIANCGVGYQINLTKNQFDLTMSSNNVFNTDYQNERYYAMPGRYFRFSINYKIQNIK